MDIKYLIKEKIENEINNTENIEVGIINKNNIYNFLIEPIYEEYIDTNNKKIMLWTVFKGNFSNEIVYSEKDKEFGLVMTSMENEKIFLGLYGNFLEALYSI